MAELRDRLRWDDLEIFCDLAAHGSLRKAADATAQSVETIRRRINALEVSIGERLFRRTPQGLEITAAGREILVKAREAHDAITAIARMSGAERRRERRRLRVSLPDDIGALIFVPALADGFGASAMTLDIRLIDPAAKPDWDSVDIGLCYTAPERADLRRRKIGKIEFGMFQRDGAGLAEKTNGGGGDRHLLLPPDSHPVFSQGGFAGLRSSRAGNNAWRINNALVRRAMIAETDAIGLLPSLRGHPELARAVLDDDREMSGALDLWLGFHADAGDALEGRALIDFLVALAAPNHQIFAPEGTPPVMTAGFHGNPPVFNGAD
jgi:DNA-binding transcriptional LysR family regulator